MASERLRECLGPDETVETTWRGTLTRPDGTATARIAATDRRLLCESADGSITDIDYEHVTSMETTTGTETTYEGVDYRHVMAGGAVVFAAAFLLAVGSGSGAVALVLALIAAGGVGAVEYGWSRRDEYDGLRRQDREVTQATVVTRDGRVHRITVDDGDAAATLNRVARSGDGDDRRQSPEPRRVVG